MKRRAATQVDARWHPVLTGVIARLLVVIVAAIAYSNTLDVPFTFDDMQNIVDNTDVHMTDITPDALRRAASFEPTPRPVAYVTFALNHAVHGLDVAGYHVVNTLIHALTGLLVFAFAVAFSRLVRKDDSSLGTTLFALAVALLFVAHPIQSQAVTFTVQRMTSLCAMFYMAAVLAFVRGRLASSPVARWSWWVAVLPFWALALGSKQFAVTLPAAILMVEWLFWRREDPAWWKKAGALGSAALLLMVGVAFAFKGDKLWPLLTDRYDLRDFTLAERLMTQPRAIGHYLSLVAWPWPSRFTLIYDFRTSTGLFTPWTTLPMILAVLGGGVAGLAMVRKSPVLSFALLWLLVHLVVESSVIPLEMVYEHRMYLPMVGLCLLIAHAGFAVLKRPVPATAVLLVLSGALTAATIVRNQDWRDPERFWLANAANAPGAPRVPYNLGRHYFETQQYDLALEQARRAVDADPNMQVAYSRIAFVLRIQGDLDGALDALTRGLSIPAEQLNPRQDVTMSLRFQRGQLLNMMGRADEALDDLDEALRLHDLDEATKPEPERVEDFFAMSQKALALMNLARDAEAVPLLERVVGIQPMLSEAQNNLAWILAASRDESLHDGARAVTHATEACKLTNYQNPATLSTLAAAHARAGNFTAAIEAQKRALRYAGGASQARYAARLELYENGQPYTME